MILVDTTVLVYALGSDHPLRDPCRDAVAAIGDGRLTATTTVEVIQEFTHVRARRRGRDEAASRAADYATVFAPLTTIDVDDLAEGLALFRRHDRIGAFDAILAAAAMRREHITGVMSADRAFGSIPGLTYVDPADAGFRDALGI